MCSWRELRQVHGIAHNMAKVEEHNVDGRSVRVCVHRKGATRASGPGSPGLPDDLCDLGQPVLIPGSMGKAAYVLIGYDRSHAANVWLHVTWGGSRHEPRQGIAGRLAGPNGSNQLVENFRVVRLAPV